MANNPYVNKVQLADGTSLIDISDTTATASDVANSKYIYMADGSKVQGSITSRFSSDLTASGATVTVPSGYYSAQASKSVASGTAGTPTASKGTVSNHAVSVTPSVTNSSGYITGGTKNGTAVTVSASELVSGTLPVTQNGTADVTNYASVNVTVPSGEDIPVFTINLSTNPPTATCNKTFAECETLLNANNTNAIAYAPSVPTKVPMAAHNYVSNYEIVYAIYDAYGYPMADIAYFNGGTVSYYEPSTLNNSLPTQPSSTHTGTLKATIDRSTSERYLNIAKGYYPSDAYYTLSAVPNGTAGTPSATKGTVSNHSISVTPSVTNTTGYITGSTKTGTAVTVSASELVSGSETKTANGTYDVTNLASLVVNVASGTSKNTQVVQSTTRTNASTLTAIGSELTVSKTGTYDIYYSCFRTNTSSSYTWATRLYINGTAYGTAENTTWTNNQQNTHLSNISLTANDKLRVYGRNTRGTSYYICAPMLVIIEA